MRKTRLTRIVITVAAIAGLTGGLSLAGGGTSLAAVQQQTHPVAVKVTSVPQAEALDYTCYFPITGFYCAAHVFKGAPLFKSSGALDEILPENDTVHVTCYYNGNPPKPYKGDGYQDHVNYENIPHSISGHIPDHYVNFDNQTPGQVGIPPC